MITLSLRVTAAGLAAITAATFAGPAIASATAMSSSSNPVATAIKQQDQKDKAQLASLKHFNATTASQAKALLPKLTAADKALQSAARGVAGVHATSTSQKTGQADWVNGTRQQAQGVDRVETVVRNLIKGDKTGAKTQLTAALKTVASGDKLCAKGDGLLGLPKTD